MPRFLRGLSQVRKMTSSSAIPSTMLAAVYKPGNDNLVLEPHRPVPKPEAGHVLLKVLACGVCHSDVTILSGLGQDPRTYTFGHEICGTPVLLGEGVDPNVARKDKRYIVLDIAPGLVEPGLAVVGVGLDGGFAQYVIVDARQLIEVPEGLPVEVAAIAADAGTTAFNAVHNTAGIKEGTNFKVLIFGIGGLGHLAVQYAKHFGATVYVCDIKPKARQLALDVGATQAFDLIDLQKETSQNHFGVDITIDFVSNAETFSLAMAALTNNQTTFPPLGKAVMVGWTYDTLSFKTVDIIDSGIQILPSIYGPASAAVSALELFASGAVKPTVHALPLKDVNKAIDQLRAFETTGRKVVIPPHTH